MHEAVRQRLSIQFPPSTPITLCLVSFSKRVLSKCVEIPSHLSFYGHSVL